MHECIYQVVKRRTNLFSVIVVCCSAVLSFAVCRIVLFWMRYCSPAMMQVGKSERKQGMLVGRSGVEEESQKDDGEKRKKKESLGALFVINFHPLFFFAFQRTNSLTRRPF